MNHKLSFQGRIAILSVLVANLTSSCQKVANPIAPGNLSTTQLAAQSSDYQVQEDISTYKVVTSDNIGLIGDGIFNNTYTINEFLRHANRTRLVFLPGVYVVDGLVVSSDYCALDGSGAEIKVSKSSTPLSVIDIAANNVYIKDFKIDGSNHPSLRFGVIVWKKQNVTVESITSSNFKAQGVVLSSSSHCNVRKCVVSNCGSGVEAWGGDARVSPGAGIRDIDIAECQITNSGEAGILGTNVDDIRIKYNSIDGAGDVGIDLEGGTNFDVLGNKSKNCNYGSITLFYTCASGLIRSNFVSVNNGKAGIRVTDYPSMPIHDVSIDGNIIDSDNSIGVLLDEAGSNHIKITNNSIKANAVYGIRSMSNNDCSVWDNKLDMKNCAVGISDEGGSNWIIQGNEVHTENDITQFPQSVGISTHWSSYDFPASSNLISRNKVTGFADSTTSYTGPSN